MIPAPSGRDRGFSDLHPYLQRGEGPLRGGLGTGYLKLWGAIYPSNAGAQSWKIRVLEAVLLYLDLRTHGTLGLISIIYDLVICKCLIGEHIDLTNLEQGN